MLLPLLLSTQSSLAAEFKTIPLPDDIEVRASLSNQAPFVFSGYSKGSELQILAAISESLGKPIKTSTRFGRSTYYFDTPEGEAKVTLTKDSVGLQIDIMVTP